jgi:dTDP-glucose 4,6-dehydratase
MKILVTGGAGFIGSNFVKYILAQDENVEIANLDLLTYAGNLKNLTGIPDPARYKFIQADICDQELVEKVMVENDISVVVHFAAESHVDRSIEGPATFIHSNITGTFSLLEAARKIWSNKEDGFRRFHHISTDEVFGSLRLDEPAFTEKTAYDPKSPYSASKAASDHLVRAYSNTYGLPVTISNCSNNYGPNQFPEKLIPVVVMSCLSGKDIPVYGDGKQIRDWLYVEDHCEAIWNIVLNGRNGETYNIGGESEITNIEIIRAISEILDEKLPESEYLPHEQLISFVKDRPGHDRRYAINISKINSELGWSPRETMRSGLEKTVQWYLDNQEWVDEINSRQETQDWMQKNYSSR